ncbi:SDH family Clp fold serine proteinase [Rhizobium leguminosarum]|uniref:SDH family Clp fold serine proteinase n=1 Tax=Rhizobium leguminosarum TaxID=384 RepID=UPI0013B81214|nr:ATP-dependent Clp protease proteolytic subunit [Rhizobium leguminosarum]NEI63948.1 serine dehydrogenasease [Rhizobium leguminosarum]
MAVYDDIIFTVVREAEAALSDKLDADIIYLYSEMRMSVFAWFREVIEKLAARPEKKDAIAIFLTTPGGQAEAVEKFVEVIRHHYPLVYFVVPVAAMSAGTIFCMSGDKIYMDYSSSLGPIDPQVPDREGKLLVPALGHLDKLNEMIEKSRNNTITPAEFQWLMNQDLAMLRFYEQARDLSIALLEKWLVQYKFKDWTHHRTTSPGTAVTAEEKQVRANEIATLLSNNTHWHSHGRMIGMTTLKNVCRLEIDDFGNDKDLQAAVRRYNDTITEYIGRMDMRAFLYSSHVN